MRRYRHVALGGTFDRLHVGHEALLRSAFRLGEHVAVGLTSPKFLAEHPKRGRRPVAPVRARRAALERWLRARFPLHRWSVRTLDDRFGAAVGPGIDALVVSPDTLAGGREVNRERVRRGLAPLAVVVVPLVLADDLEPVSSTRIRAGEVDRQGRRIAPIRVGLSASEPELLAVLERSVRRAFRRPRLTSRRGRRAAAPGRGGLRQGAEAARGSGDLGVALGRDRGGGFSFALAGRHVSLPVRHLTARSLPALERAVLGSIRPSSAKPL